ncbi:MAG: hypothetical protein COS82_06365 [Zetaproteobacteria bacterium CG06_land_8_20_14_3_00_59_53]|nr:MAG: hypothetical protein COX56_10090 [Zetaproteobacteria bacterium CG23_combo_of_CG06-09_8_20_14_all_59_86]PIQ64339.1 MAG: hypothetical protein COV97_10585 [Zetaproteobacteria bacterium CG11_big_fil_rev_8_21_14_0_20_59_439]PIU70315.1 MAG: hypothetical protein COS82_06365 [Zetaproteobacteria bacterium CG06_land_8_20_14_3_00_59_53]PIU97313.1 MAG: hypothetical protein COS62_04465 [Zetaproteobacteria bacterium CG03_land_8_20_14_0_80_59_51]PIY45042.1 MAG: hypothetical protein COZ02_10750 [Zetapr
MTSQRSPLPAMLLLALCLAGCATAQQQQAATIGGIQGAAVGAAAGSINHNSVEGAIVGGIIGATSAAILNQPQATTQPFNMQQQDPSEE